MDFETTKGLRQTKITKRLVDSLRPKDEVYSVWDHEVPGFGVRVMTTGRKSFVLKYSINRMQRWITLGRYGDLTVDEARKLAQTRRGEVAKGLDPTVDLRARRSAPTISELIERFIAEHVEVKTRKSTAEGYTRYLHNVIEPKLGKLLVRDLSPDEVAKFHHGLSGC